MDYNGLVELASSSTDSAALGLGTFQLTDNRDEHPYIVRRLADGNCWMAQNLDLNLSDFAFTRNLTNKNTDLNTEGKTYYDPAATAFSQAQTITDAEGYDGPELTQENYFAILSKGLFDDDTVEYQFLPDGVWGNKFGSFNTIPRTKSESLEYTKGTGMDGTTYSEGSTDEEWQANRANLYRGTYYNWFAATAESQFENAAAIDSLCSYGWQLTGSGKSWNSIFRTYAQGSLGVNAYTTVPVSLSYAGIVESSGSVAFLNQDARAWTSNSSSLSNASAMLINSSNGSVHAAYAAYKLRAIPIRCVNKGSNQETVVSTCAANSICYNANGGSGSMDNQSVTAAETPADTSAMLTAPSFTRTGYAFAGWSTAPNGYGTTYGPNETVTVGDLSSAGFQLYAHWIKSSGTMQDFTATQCTAMAEHEVIALTDNRDGNTYSVAKLKDGNCWMTSNLALNLADFAGENPAKGYLTTENTDLSASRTDLIEVASTGGGNSGVKRWDPEKSTRIKWESTYASELQSRNLTRDFTGLSELLLGQAQPKQFQSSADGLQNWRWSTTVSDDGSFSPVSVTVNNNSEIPRSHYSGMAHGTYYNYYSVTAESGKYNVNGCAADSVCPNGWRLSTNSGNYSWDNLFRIKYSWMTASSQTNATAFAKMRQAPVSLVLSGDYESNGGISNSGHGIFYQTPDAYQSSFNHSLNAFNSSGYIGLQGGYLQTYGFTARCIRSSEE